jgi:type VI protein secretion system component Hcp
MAIDAFLELCAPGGAAVPGESTDDKFKKKIALRSVSFYSNIAGSKKKKKDGEDGDEDDDEDDDEPKPSKSSKSTESKRPLEFFLKITKEVDASSPTLFQEYARKAKVDEALPFDSAKVSLRKTQGKTQFVFLVLKMTKLFVTSYSIEADDDDKLAKETVTFCFESCTLAYAPQKAAGAKTATISGWNFETRQQTCLDIDKEVDLTSY